MLTESIILAGGLGTRLKSVSGEIPKPLVDVSGKPFIYYIMDNLLNQGVSHIIIAVSYKADLFISEIGNEYKGVKVSYSIEESPLGTGGAIKQAMSLCSSSDILIVNGDTYLEIDFQEFFKSHKKINAIMSMALVNMDDVSRYGSVKLHGEKIIGFSEKGASGGGYINGGAYLLSSVHLDLPDQAFSFEDVVLKELFSEINPFLCESYFIDIGIPSDYYRACETFKG